VALTAAGSTLTREQFRQTLQAEFPMEPAASAGGQIVIGSSGDISGTNPMLVSDTVSIDILGLAFETLIGASPIDGRPVPALADSWTVSDDGLVYMFKINTAAAWHDGTDVTAEDVAFSFDAILNPNLNSPYRTQVREVVASYRVVDPDTFEVTATDRFVTFLYNGPGSVFIMPKHIWSQVPAEQWSFNGGSTGEDMTRVIGSGPFMFSAWEQGQRVSLVKNPNHYDTVPIVDEVVMVTQPETDTLVRSLEAGDIDVIEILPVADTATIQNTAGFNVAVYDFFTFTSFIMNMDPDRNSPLADSRVRQALYRAIDRNSITENLFLGFGKAAVGTQPPISPSYAPDQLQPEYAYDPDAARQLLADAGWTDTDEDGAVDKDGDELSMSMLYVSGDATVNQMLSYMQEAWDAVGIDVELENISGETLFQRLDEGDFDLTVILFELPPDGSQGLLFTCGAIETGFNFGGYCNPRYDELDAMQLREFDPQRRVQLQIELSKVLWQDLPVGPLRFGIARTGYSTRIHNFYPNGYGFLWSLPFVWVEAE
jgi:peptide/nickel transport system substrate-binding protein